MNDDFKCENDMCNHNLFSISADTLVELYLLVVLKLLVMKHYHIWRK